MSSMIPHVMWTLVMSTRETSLIHYFTYPACDVLALIEMNLEQLLLAPEPQLNVSSSSEMRSIALMTTEL